MNRYEPAHITNERTTGPTMPASTAEQLRATLAAELGRMGFSPLVPHTRTRRASTGDLAGAARAGLPERPDGTDLGRSTR